MRRVGFPSPGGGGVPPSPPPRRGSAAPRPAPASRAARLVVWANPHWSAPGFLAAIIAAAGLATEHPRRFGAPPRWLSAGVLGTTAILAAAFYALPLLTSTIVPPQLDPAANYYGWPQ